MLYDNIKLIAFYLPQYHPIPENDAWWGKGFTEWTNVAKAKPLFKAHYQPHIPADLGFYDLRLSETRIAQAELAREYGIYGFCYYHYWFNGKRLLERPFTEVLESGKPDFPFCLCWANENWTRKWDGEDNEILMKQDYNFEDDRRHIKSLFNAFEDKRYIRINGKPIFLVYRTEYLPNPKKTSEIWREEAKKAGIGELYLIRGESLSRKDPFLMGFDAAVEFAPDWQNRGELLNRDRTFFYTMLVKLGIIKDPYFDNYVSSYDGLMLDMLAKPLPSYEWFRCITPSWDNSPRRSTGGNIFLNSTPEKYQKWLEKIMAYTVHSFKGDDKFVFINAWNEWAEGNNLEPCLRWGRAYLEATQRALATDPVLETVNFSDVSEDPTPTVAAIDSINGINLHNSKERPVILKKSKFLDICGWAIDAPNKSVAGGVLIDIDGKTFPAEYGFQRHDVQKVFGARYINCGFRIFLPITQVASGSHILNIRTISKNQKSYYSLPKADISIDIHNEKK